MATPPVSKPAVAQPVKLGGMCEECRGAERPVEDGPVIQPCNQRNKAGGEAQVVVADVATMGRQDVDPCLRGDLLDDAGAGIGRQGGDVVEGELQLGRKPRIRPGEEIEDRLPDARAPP